MASYDVPLRSDRWQLAGAGPITIDAEGAVLLANFGASAPAPGDVTDSISIGGTGIEGRYTYEGADNVYLRLPAPRAAEPINVTVLKEGAAGAAITPYAPNLALSTDADTDLTGALLTGFEGDATDSAPTITGATDAAGSFTIGAPKSLAVGGVLTINANGSFAFAPGADFDGLKGDATEAINTVTLTVTGNGTSLTATFTLDITVSGVNDGPTAVNDTATTDNATTATGNFLTDGTDDSHPQSEAMWVDRINGAAFGGGLAIRLDSGAEMIVNGQTGAWTYKPNGRAAGDEVVTYRVIDRFGATGEGTLTITVSAA